MSESIICEAMRVVAELAFALNAPPMNGHPNCWELQVDEHWKIAVNGHRDPRKTTGGVEVMPFNCYVEFNGWPAGFFDPYGGVLCAGAVGNEDALIAAMRTRLEKETAASNRAES